jgi:hypothetical protein
MRTKYYLYIFGITFLFGCTRQLKFDASRWAEEPSERYRMTEDLEESRLLIGKSREEVVMMLTTERCKGCDDSTGNLMYIIRVEKHLRGGEAEVFDVMFKNDTVVEAMTRK